MKIMPKISKIFNNIKYNKEQKMINDYVNLDWTMEADTFNKLYEARKTIANYARNKGVTVSITRAEKDIPENHSAFEEQHLSGKIKVLVSDLFGTRESGAYIPADPNSTGTYSVQKTLLFNVPGEDTQIVRKTVSVHEDNFLRTVYRTIEHAVKNISGQSNQI